MGYVVLRADAKHGPWEKVGDSDKEEATAAVKQIATRVPQPTSVGEATSSNDIDPSGWYVAIPAKSWKPVELKRRTETFLDVK